MIELNRREFLGASAAGAGAVLLGTQLGSHSVMADETGEWPPRLPAVKIYKVYIGRTGGIYLSRPKEEIAKFEKYLANVERKLGDVKFVGGELVPPAEVDKVVAKLGDADGILLFHLSGHGGGAPKAAMDKIISCERRLWERLTELTQTEIYDCLRPYLDTATIRPLLSRQKKLSRHIQRLIETKGEENVLFVLN